MNSTRKTVLAEIQAQFPVCIAKFNEFLAKSDGGGGPSATPPALAPLIPGNAQLQEAALSCNLALGRPANAATFATNLIALDPSHVAARGALAEARKAAGDIDAEIEHRKALALSNANPLHPLVRLRDLHDVASTILCGTLDTAASDNWKKCSLPRAMSS